MGGERFTSVHVAAGESDLWIGWKASRAKPEEIERAAAETLERARAEITAYAEFHPLFLKAFDPLVDDRTAPPVVRAMLRAAEAAGVGPMAAVAGAIAEAVGRSLEAAYGLQEIVVENGGDLWMNLREPLTTGVYAGLSSLSLTFGIVVDPAYCPCGLACSSGTVGPSISFGKADAAVVLSRDAAAADAWATALGNRIRYEADLEGAVAATAASVVEDERLRPLGVLAVLADRLAAAGVVRLAGL